MKREMHYEGTYCLARLAGLSKQAAKTIAYANTYVDHSVKKEVRNHEAGGMLVPEETAHHFYQVQNILPVHQRYIWVPFHFLPGCQGPNFFERVTCVKASDNPLAEPMMEHNLRAALGNEFGLQLIGVTCHVLQDSFSHQGFSGLVSPLNRIEGRSLDYLNADAATKKQLEKEEGSFLERFWGEIKGSKWYVKLKGFLANLGEDFSGGLGHAAAFTCPDLPYLHWAYTYEAGPQDGQPLTRQNIEEFLESCQYLHAYLQRVAQAAKGVHPTWVDDSLARDWDPELENRIRQILLVQEDTDGRANAWRQALSSGDLHPAGQGETFPPYTHKTWEAQRDQFPEMLYPRDVVKLEAFGFYQAASFHRHYLLRELMPHHGVVVV